MSGPPLAPSANTSAGATLGHTATNDPAGTPPHPGRVACSAGVPPPVGAAKSLDRAGPAEQSRRMDIRIQCLCIDTGDPARIASFWQSALGWRRTFEEEDQVILEPPEGSPEDGIVPDLLFLKVPERKVVKNRLHLDLRPGDQAAEVSRLEALGARRVGIGQGEVGWVVMADPDGNEFDVLQPLTPDQLPPGHDALGRRTAAGARA